MQPRTDEAPPAETAAGTLATALSILDEQITGEVGYDKATLAAAWSQVRRVAIATLAPPPAAKPRGTLAERARAFATLVGADMDRLAQEPSPDSATAIGLTALVAVPAFVALLTEAITEVADAIRVGNMGHDEIARELALTRRNEIQRAEARGAAGGGLYPEAG